MNAESDAVNATKGGVGAGGSRPRIRCIMRDWASALRVNTPRVEPRVWGLTRYVYVCVYTHIYIYI